ncbi:MAG: dephospho-CoA kinase, partial [Deltaproteobacteria bacterium]|nr:dephospho-CoA kinase [Deltaproteobacteria bacterium]
QVAVPLLIELNLQYMFDQLVVVYSSPEMQIKRLAQRDGISTEEAANMLRAQLPIDDKVGYADFVIDNNGTIEQTRKQVQKVWQELKNIQKKRGESG